MSILKKFKLWWKSATPTEKVLTILGGISTAAAVTGAVCAVKTYTEMEDKLSVEVKLYPNGKDDPNPKTLIGYQEGTEEAENFLNSKKTEKSGKKEEPTPENTEDYDRAAALLKTLWIADDILLPEDYRTAVAQAEDILSHVQNPAAEIYDILERARGENLDQEDLFEVQGKVEDLTRYLAERDGRMEDFKEQFPWLNYIPGEEKKGE